MEAVKSKKLKLKPSARDKRRYFLTNEKSNEKIEKAILDYIGVLGFAKAAYKFVKKSKKGFIMGSCFRGEREGGGGGRGLGGVSINKVSGTLKGLGV
jgi:CRISPR/Cas system CSM-associated protein Csm5 (group 7 of RAMP superfamily)